MSVQPQDPTLPVVRRTDAEPDPAWDEFVATRPGGDLVQTTTWAATKRAVGQKTALVTLRCGSRIVGGGLIIAKRLPAGIMVGYVPRGPLYDPCRATADQILDELIGSAQVIGLRLLIVQPPLGGEALNQALAARGFEPGCPPVSPEATIQLDLTRTDDELLVGMSRMRRRNLRKALESDLTVDREDDIELFHRLHRSTAQRQGFTPFDLPGIRSQWDILAPAGLCALFIARHAGKPVAGLFVTSFAGVVTCKLSGWDAADGTRRANDALHWAAARWARTTGARAFDLGGFDRRAATLLLANEALPEGFEKTAGFFKLNFGGSVLVLPQARWSVIGKARSLLQAPTRWLLTTRWVVRVAQRVRA